MWLKRLKITWKNLKKKKKQTNKQTLHLERYYYILRTKEKKNTNAIYNLIHTHTHTHTHTYIYIITLDKYYKRIIT